MSKYVIILSDDKIKIKLPVNPKELEVTSSQAIEKYEILKLGQIAIPSHLGLKQYNFDAEFPYEKLHYVETSSDFKDADACLGQFERWRINKVPIRFMAGRFVGSNMVKGNAINTLVLIESLTITERAGEEQDKYVSFRLLEYKEYSKKYKKTGETRNSNNPKSTGTYIVKTGDTLWGIAKKYYGDGTKYTNIYNANRKIISNPSLIYPGQKLVIPS